MRKPRKEAGTLHGPQFLARVRSQNHIADRQRELQQPRDGCAVLLTSDDTPWLIPHLRPDDWVSHRDANWQIQQAVKQGRIRNRCKRYTHAALMLSSIETRVSSHAHT
jgi:hypothetical protein